MTDKEKIREEVEKLKSQLLRGACSSQIAMETRCMEEAYNEVLSILDTMQEEPVKRTPADIEAAMQEVEEKSRVFTEAHKGEDTYTILAQMRGEEPISEDLEKEMDYLSKRYPEVSFAKLSRIAVHVANWQKKQCNNEANHALVEQIKTQQLCYEKGMADMKQQMMKNIWKPADGDDLPEIDREVVVLIQPYPLENSEYAVSFAHRPNPDGWDGKRLSTGKVEHYIPKTYGKGEWNIPNIIYWLDVELPKEIEL